MLMEMIYNGRALSGDCPLHATLLQFLQQTCEDALDLEGPFHDGHRCVDLRLELAHRWAGKELHQSGPEEQAVEYPALVASELYSGLATHPT